MAPLSALRNYTYTYVQVHAYIMRAHKSPSQQKG